MSETANWNRMAALSEVLLGESKAVSMGDGRSIALFNMQGQIYATDNQCPHMGYPLTHGSVRHGVLTCDWHGRHDGADLVRTCLQDLGLFSIHTFARAHGQKLASDVGRRVGDD